jgi:hypothetical protein
VKRASRLSIERESKLYEKKDSGTSVGDSLRSLDIAEVITLTSDISKSVKGSTCEPDCDCPYCTFRNLQEIFGPPVPPVIYCVPRTGLFWRLLCFGPVPALGKRYLKEEKLDKPSKTYIWHKWRDMQHLNEYTMKPVDTVVVNQVIGNVAF